LIYGSLYGPIIDNISTQMAILINRVVYIPQNDIEIILYISDIVSKNEKKCLVLVTNDSAIRVVAPIDEIFFGRYYRSTNNFSSPINHLPNYLVTMARVCHNIEKIIIPEEAMQVVFDFVNEKLYTKKIIPIPEILFKVDIDKLYFCIKKQNCFENQYRFEKYPVDNIISHRFLQYYLLLSFINDVCVDVKYNLIVQFINLIIIF
jgi:hypothetical protein